jgi:ferritin
LQSDEEREHAMKLFDFVLDRGETPILYEIEKPSTDYESVLDVMERSLKHEKKVTKLINDLYELAMKENDHATQVQLQWFITEQVEEEKSITDIVERLRMAGSDSAALLMLDREVGARTGTD